MIITTEQYLMGRDARFPGDLTDEILANIRDLLPRVNMLIQLAAVEGVTFEISPRTKTILTSGWRPPAINEATHGAAPMSTHMAGQGIDIYDPNDGDLDDWLWKNQHVLGRPDINLYMEHPSATKGWAHLQSRVPKSQRNLPMNARRRWFYP
jgi:hypothetical protein